MRQGTERSEAEVCYSKRADRRHRPRNVVADPLSRCPNPSWEQLWKVQPENGKPSHDEETVDRRKPEKRIEVFDDEEHVERHEQPPEAAQEVQRPAAHDFTAPHNRRVSGDAGAHHEYEGKTGNFYRISALTDEFPYPVGKQRDAAPTPNHHRRRNDDPDDRRSPQPGPEDVHNGPLLPGTDRDPAFGLGYPPPDGQNPQCWQETERQNPAPAVRSENPVHDRSHEETDRERGLYEAHCAVPFLVRQGFSHQRRTHGPFAANSKSGYSPQTNELLPASCQSREAGEDRID